MAAPEEQELGQVLVVDDQGQRLAGLVRALNDAGFRAEGLSEAERVAALLAKRRFDALVGTTSTPGLDGLSLLRLARQHDLDLPVILLASPAGAKAAAQAVELGALRCLVEPIDMQMLVAAVGQANRIHRLAALRRQAVGLLEMSNRQLGDRVALEAGFERALGSLWMAYQPIVSCARREVWAFEALLRSREPTLPTQGALLDAAERLGRLPELGRAIRAQVAAAVDAAPAQAVFLNLHPRDLLDETLYSATAPLSQVARKVVLEVSERASLDAIVDLRTRAEALRALGFRLAIDDFGSGYAGLATYAKLEPELVKLDLALVRDLPDSPARQGFIRSLTELTREMGVAAIAVGVETLEEREALIASGCDLLQGFLFARPDKAFPTVSPVKFSGANLRISKRLGISRIAVRLLDVDRLRTHPLRDISEKGGLIVTNAALRLGTDTRLELCGEGPPLALKAHVVREVAEEGKRLGFGVRFVFTTADVEQKVKEIVARYGERQPAEERDATVKR